MESRHTSEVTRSERPLHLALGVTGGIGAYKAALIVRGFAGAGVRVTVIMTRNAIRFITPLTLQTLTGNRVITDQFEDAGAEWDVQHVSLSKLADGLLVAPATANIIGKFASGIADDFLSTFYTAFQGPVFVAPAMNTAMFDHPAVRHNLGLLRDRGVRIIEPGEGFLACGDTGRGRLAEPAGIVSEVLAALRRSDTAPLDGVRVLVTAGPTRERLDPVRFLTNPSSGKMGYALAREAVRRGSDVTLVSGPTSLPPPAGCELLRVESCEEMQRAVEGLLETAEVMIMAAAPADYRPTASSDEKMHKTEGDLHLTLARTPDILAGLGARKGDRVLVGFAAETDTDPEPSARSKMQRKNLDMIVANRVGIEGSGFAADANTGVVIDRRGRRTEIPLVSKETMAARILDLIAVYHAETKAS